MAAQGGYSGNDFMTMQREAEKRVMEMQRRAKNTVETGTSKQEASHPAMVPASEKPVSRHNFLDMLNLKSLFEGKDTSLVLMVLALLNSEETDPLLMLALLYIMM